LCQLQDLRGRTGVIIRSGTLSSFCFSFFRFARRGEAKKRKTDKTISTMLPQAKRRLSDIPRKPVRTADGTTNPKGATIGAPAADLPPREMQ
jgi:hypothetical protein